MAKGSPIIPVRIPPLFLATIDTAIGELNQRTRGTPYNRSSFILKALTEKIDHIHRSRKNGKPRKSLTSPPIET